MKVAIVAESFLPQTNGVVHSILRVLDHLVEDRHDEVLVIAPADPQGVPEEVRGARVVTVPSWALPAYPQVRVATGRSAPLVRELRRFDPDVVHLASPYVLGWRGLLAAQQLRLPTVAVYQTDVPGYAAGYGLGHVERLAWKRVYDIHERATLTLAPSHASRTALESHGVNRVQLWRRGVDSGRFSPARRDEALRSTWGAGQPLVGFVGRLAAEKNVDALTALTDLPVGLVVVGDGPERPRLERLLPQAHFTGMLHGDDLARAMASLDVLVHTGEHDTFCQVVQEAMACAVPVVAPAVGGPLDLVDPSRTGWLYEPGNRGDLRERVRDLAGDPHKARAMGEAARRQVQNRSWRSVCSELTGHYAAAVETHQWLPPQQIGLRHWSTRRALQRQSDLARWTASGYPA